MTLRCQREARRAAAERFVDGRDAADFEEAGFGVGARVGQHLELRLNHFEVAGGAGGLDLAVDGDGLAGLELAVEIGAVEPDALERAAALADGELEDGRAGGCAGASSRELRR